ANVGQRAIESLGQEEQDDDRVAESLGLGERQCTMRPEAEGRKVVRGEWGGHVHRAGEHIKLRATGERQVCDAHTFEFASDSAAIAPTARCAAYREGPRAADCRRRP